MARRREPETVVDEEPELLRAGFVFIVHPQIEGSRSSVPAHLVAHHAARGWVLADSTPVEDPSTGIPADPSPQEDQQ